ncbi:hypothetical protein [Microbacterium sp. KNMS]
MDIDQLIDMGDEEYALVVMQAAKARREFPGWWRAVLSPELIDATEQVLRDAMAVAERQAEDRARFPHAYGFVKKVRSLLAEVTLARICGVEP